MDTPATASLSFDPGNITSKVGETFRVALNIFTDKQPVLSTDVWVSYNPEMVEPILPIMRGDTFETVDAKLLSPGRLYIYGIQSDKNTLESANGTLAEITFKSLKNGTSQFTFECSPGTQERSQIIKNSESLENIINCTRTVSHTATVDIKGDVLGITEKNNGINMAYLTLTLVMLLVTAFLFIKYRKLSKDKQKTQGL